MPCSLRCVTGVHILQEGISYRMICLTGGHVLNEDSFYCWVCLIASHVLHEGMSYRWTCLAGVHLDIRTGFIGWHVMQEVCITGRHVVVVVMSFMRSYVKGGYV